MKTALVTGGCGFIGSNLVDSLKEMEYKVVVIDDLSAGKKEYCRNDVEYIFEDFKKVLLKDLDFKIDAIKNGSSPVDSTFAFIFFPS